MASTARVTALRMWHPLHWLFSRILPWSSARVARPVSRTFFLALGTLTAAAGAIGVLAWGFDGLLLAPIVLVLGAYLRIRPIANSVAWWVGGAGRIVLEIGEGRVRGRLRPLWSDEVRGSDGPWWDIDIAAEDVLAARVERHHAGPTLVLDLAPSVAARLCTAAGTARWVAVSRDRVGSPAAWQLGIMRPPGLRGLALRTLLEALEDEGIPAAHPRRPWSTSHDQRHPLTVVP